MKKKFLLIAVLILTLTVMPLVMTACGDTNEGLGSLYVQSSSVKEFSGYEKFFEVPSGWFVRTISSTLTDIGYNENLDGFILEASDKSGNLSFMFRKDSQPLFKVSDGIKAIRIKGNLLAAKRGNSAFVYDLKAGKIVLSEQRLSNVVEGTSIDSVIKILDNGLIAVNSIYDIENQKSSNTGYTSIYRPTYTGDATKRGALVARIKNVKKSLSILDGFDNLYVSITADQVSEEDSTAQDRVYRIPQIGTQVVNNDGDKLLTKSGQSNYTSELTYIGYGRFYCVESWTVSSDSEYDYVLSDTYYKLKREVYHASTDSTFGYSSNIVIKKLSNKYYGSTKNGIATSTFLNGDRMYAAECYTIGTNKQASYDQFILDTNLDIELSLSGNFGRQLSGLKEGDVSLYELILDYVDGYGYAPIGTGIMRLYDKNGNVMFENKDNVITSAVLNDGMIIVSTTKDGKDLYGAFDLSGKLVLDFQYKSLQPFRGYYTIGEKYDENGYANLVIVGKDGTVQTKLSDGKDTLTDVSTTGDGKEIYTLGCYMYNVKVDGKTLHGIKNFNVNTSKNVVLPAMMPKGSSLYPATANKTFIIMYNEDINTTIPYVVYLLK